jgi:hypothetical protein
MVIPVREVLYYRKLINSMFNVCLKSDDVRLAMGLPVYQKNGTEADISERDLADIPDRLKKFKEMNNVRMNKRRMRRRTGIFATKDHILNTLQRVNYNRNAKKKEKANNKGGLDLFLEGKSNGVESSDDSEKWSKDLLMNKVSMNATKKSGFGKRFSASSRSNKMRSSASKSEYFNFR